MKLGRLPRAFRPEIPHYSALAMGKTLAPPPVSVDWTTGVNPDWGMMLNDQRGCCTIAGAGHAMQLWSAHGRAQEITVSNDNVLEAYEEFCGFDPNNPDATDNGGIEQNVLAMWLHRGMPIAQGRSRIKALVEVDPRNHDDVKRVVNDCGLTYIGFTVPAFLMGGSIPMDWDVHPSGDNSPIGGHCVINPKFDPDSLGVVSWGSGAYRMSWRFWDQFVDECYGLAHPWWIEATGKTPLGMTLDELEAAMSQMREAA